MKSLASSKKASADFSFSSVRLPCVFFANRGSGMRHAFFVSVILPVTCDGLDPLCIGNERAVNKFKRASYASRGFTQKNVSPKQMNNAWMTWSFQVNFMYNPVL